MRQAKTETSVDRYPIPGGERCYPETRGGQHGKNEISQSSKKELLEEAENARREQTRPLCVGALIHDC